ncbi:MAG: tetratricopeptide repeat protein [Rhodospirillaceae bacterium]|nr:tetratricopeptide repeat protein [Rhodospirillales bacterium]
MTTKNDDASADLLIQEVDDELRHEQMQQLWRKHGSWAVAAAVALVLSVAGWQGWTTWQTKQRVQSGATFTAAMQSLEQGNKDDALAALGKVAADGSSGYRVLADMKLADVKLNAGDRDGAIALYERVAASGADDVYRDLARLKAAYLKLDGSEPAAVEKLVEKLAVESSPWRHSAREVLALAASKRGDEAKAAELFRKIADDPAAPQGVRARAAEMLAATTGAKAKG